MTYLYTRVDKEGRKFHVYWNDSTERIVELCE